MADAIDHELGATIEQHRAADAAGHQGVGGGVPDSGAGEGGEGAGLAVVVAARRYLDYVCTMNYTPGQS